MNRLGPRLLRLIAVVTTLAWTAACRERVASGLAHSDTLPPPPRVGAVADSPGAPASPAPPDSSASACLEHRVAPAPGDSGIDTTIHMDVRFGSVFLCRIHPSLPVFRFDIMGDSVENSIVGIRVHQGENAPVSQELAGGGDEAPYRGAAYFRVVDLNADGYGDLMLMSWWGATGNTGHDVWLYDPARTRFVADTELSGLSNVEPIEGRPCITTHGVGGHAGAIYGDSEHCLEGGHWVLTRSESQGEDSGGHRLIKVTEERRNGRMERVRVDTTVDSTWN